MKIINNAPASKVLRFRDLEAGTVFSYGGTALVKTMDDQGIDPTDGDVFAPDLDHIPDAVYLDAVLYLHGAPKS